MEPVVLCNYLVIAATCGFSFAGFRNPGLVDQYIFWPQAILAGREYRRLVTSAFLHRDGLHLAANMITLYLFGGPIERFYGATQFLAIYFAAIIGGNLLALFIHRHHDYRAYGASGGVSGILLAHIFLFPGGSIFPYYIPVPIPSWLYAIFYLAISFYGMKKQVGDVGHDAHLGGALVGLYTAAALHRQIIQGSPKLFAAISVGTILLIVYLAKNPLFLPLGRISFARPRTGESELPEYKQRERQLDAILAKISEKGLQSLTPDEQAILRETSGKYERRATSQKPKSGLPF